MDRFFCAASRIGRDDSRRSDPPELPDPGASPFLREPPGRDRGARAGSSPSAREARALDSFFTRTAAGSFTFFGRSFGS